MSEHSTSRFGEVTGFVLAITLAAFIVRVLVFILLPEQGIPDSSAYIRAGENLFGEGMIRDHYVMPVYPIWTYVLGSLGMLGFMEILVSTLTILLLAALSHTMFRSNAAALITAGCAAVYPHFVFFSALVLTETLYIAILTSAFLLLYRRRFVWGCALLVLSILVRPSLELILPIVVVAFSLVVHKEGVFMAVRRLGVFALFYAVMMAPWWVHNYAKYDQFVRLTLSDGMVFYAGNNPLNRSGGGIMVIDGVDGDYDISEFHGITDPIERNRALRSAALGYIVSDPGHFVKMMGVKFLRFWRLWPYTPQYNRPIYIAVSLMSYGLVLLGAIAYLCQFGRRHWRLCLPIFLVVGYLSLVHMVTIASIRYRVPIEGFLIVLAGYWFSRAIKAIGDRAGGPKPA